LDEIEHNRPKTGALDEREEHVEELKEAIVQEVQLVISTIDRRV